MRRIQLSLLVIFAILSCVAGKQAELQADVHGGAPRTEKTAEEALKWLAKQQQKDGNWVLRLEDDKRPDKEIQATATQATGLVLLAYFGAGHTHKDGEYQKVTQAGLNYLVREMKVLEERGDLRGGAGMEAQGVAAVALCEAFGLTSDETLKLPAQRAVNFIVGAQDPMAGGWSQQARGGNDMHVFAWQLQALRSGHPLGLEVPKEVIEKAEKYLDAQQTGKGRYYGRLRPGKDLQATAVGLLIRTALGWKRTDERMVDGTDFLLKLGPADHCVEHNYFATQILFHVGGDAGTKWNEKLHPLIVERQVDEGELRGSWYDADDVQAKTRGRLYQTALNVMALEVCYRHLTIYDVLGREDFHDEDFPL